MYSTCTCKHYVSFSSVTIVTKFPVCHSLTPKPSSLVTSNTEVDIPSDPWRLCMDHTHTQQCSNSGIHRRPIPLKNTSCHLRAKRNICCHGAYNNQLRRDQAVPCTVIFFMPQCISTLGPSLLDMHVQAVPCTAIFFMPQCISTLGPSLLDMHVQWTVTSYNQPCDFGWCMLALFPGPNQFFVACSMEKWGEPGIFSHVSMT